MESSERLRCANEGAFGAPTRDFDSRGIVTAPSRGGNRAHRRWRTATDAMTISRQANRGHNMRSQYEVTISATPRIVCALAHIGREAGGSFPRRGHRHGPGQRHRRAARCDAATILRRWIAPGMCVSERTRPGVLAYVSIPWKTSLLTLRVHRVEASMSYVAFDSASDDRTRTVRK
jgi:hypothetical protein